MDRADEGTAGGADGGASPDRAVRARRRLAKDLRAFPEIDERVYRAIAAVPRERFMPAGVRGQAYEDAPVPIGQGQTISAPHMVAIMASVLDVRPGHRVLEIGTGSGYHAAVLAWLARPEGRVWTVETVPELARSAARHLADAGFPEVEVHHGDGWHGLPDEAPFDRISVAAAAPEVPPPLLDQLADGGRIVVPVGRASCTLTTLDRHADRFERKVHGACVFVPLTRSGGASGVGATWRDDPDVR